MAVAKFEQLVKMLPDFNLLNFLGKQRVDRRIELLDGLLSVRRLAG